MKIINVLERVHRIKNKKCKTYGLFVTHLLICRFNIEPMLN